MNQSPPSSRRRQLLQALAATSTLGGLPTIAHPASAPDAALDSALAQAADSILRRSPETATSLGLDHGGYAPLKARLADVSRAASADWAHEAAVLRRRLAAIDPRQLGASARLRYESLSFSLERAAEGAAFPYGSGAAAGLLGGAAPYVVSQQDGALTFVPEFLDSEHRIVDSGDAESYLSRVSAFARQLDQETARIRHDAGLGVIPPAFIAEKALHQLQGFRAKPAAEQRLVGSLADRAMAAGLPGDWRSRCTRIVEREVYPALGRQITAFRTAAARTAPGAGVQRLPQGDDYYRWALKLGTTSNLTPDELHRLGLAQNEELKARMDALLRRQGMSEGSVGARVQALNTDARFLYPDTDAGRAELIAYLNDCLARIRPLLPSLSHLDLKADVMVKRVPEDIQEGAALGYMNFAALDGSRPAIYYVNLKTTALWPKYQLASLTAHEGVPGHTWQGAYLAEHHKDIPLIASLLGYNAFVEGWALYAEQLVAEHGLYADDPFGEIGYLQAQQFRACRLVADTGLHSKGWSRERTVQFLREETGRGAAAMTSETDRYCASPGQACGYKTGHNEILRLRGVAQAALGDRFDLGAFNDALVETGGVPLVILGAAVDTFIAGARTRADASPQANNLS